MNWIGAPKNLQKLRSEKFPFITFSGLKKVLEKVPLKKYNQKVVEQPGRKNEGRIYSFRLLKKITKDLLRYFIF